MKVSLSIPLLTRTIERVEINGVVYVKDTITNYLTGKTRDVHRRVKEPWSVS